MKNQLLTILGLLTLSFSLMAQEIQLETKVNGQVIDLESALSQKHTLGDVIEVRVKNHKDLKNISYDFPFYKKGISIKKTIDKDDLIKGNVLFSVEAEHKGNRVTANSFILLKKPEPTLSITVNGRSLNKTEEYHVGDKIKVVANHDGYYQGQFLSPTRVTQQNLEYVITEKDSFDGRIFISYLMKNDDNNSTEVSEFISVHKTIPPKDKNPAYVEHYYIMVNNQPYTKGDYLQLNDKVQIFAFVSDPQNLPAYTKIQAFTQGHTEIKQNEAVLEFYVDESSVFREKIDIAIYASNNNSIGTTNNYSDDPLEQYEDKNHDIDDIVEIELKVLGVLETNPVVYDEYRVEKAHQYNNNLIQSIEHRASGM